MAHPQSLNDRRNGNEGFTLIELVVVMGILAMLAAISMPRVIGHLGRAKVQTTKLEIKNIGVALDLFKIDMGRYPSSEEGLAALINQPTNLKLWKGPYLDKGTKLTDPWGNVYIYKTPGGHGEYDLYSFGADGAEGGAGDNEDIVNW